MTDTRFCDVKAPTRGKVANIHMATEVKILLSVG